MPPAASALLREMLRFNAAPPDVSASPKSSEQLPAGWQQMNDVASGRTCDINTAILQPKDSLIQLTGTTFRPPLMLKAAPSRRRRTRDLVFASGASALSAGGVSCEEQQPLEFCSTSHVNFFLPLSYHILPLLSPSSLLPPPSSLPPPLPPSATCSMFEALQEPFLAVKTGGAPPLVSNEQVQTNLQFQSTTPRFVSLSLVELSPPRRARVPVRASPRISRCGTRFDKQLTASVCCGSTARLSRQAARVLRIRRSTR